jgi:hypothetical protein
MSEGIGRMWRAGLHLQVDLQSGAMPAAFMLPHRQVLKFPALTG